MASSIVQTYSALLKEYQPHTLIKASLPEWNFLWKRLKKDTSWYGGSYRVPFEAGEFSNFSFGAMTDAAAIQSAQVQNGTISSQPEMYGALVFNHKDLDTADTKGSFMQLYPAKIRQFNNLMSSMVSLALLNGPKVCSLIPVADGGVDPILNNGLLYVKNPERLRVGQKIALHDSVKGLLSAAYVKTINRDAVTSGGAIIGGTIVVTSDIALGTVVDFSNAANQITAANSAAVYLPGGDPVSANGFTSMKDILLPNAVGGSANLYGIAKTSYPFLQAVAIDGSSISATNILDFLFDSKMEVDRLGQGNPSMMIMSLKHANSIAKLLKENFRGQYSATPMKSVGLGQKSFVLSGPMGDMEILAVREMSDSEIHIIDEASFVFAGHDFFSVMDYGTDNDFYTVRATTGVKYITDIKLYGDLICINPSHNGIIYSIAY